MTQAITRARVCEALSKAECFVPDFTTRKKTALSWNKVYISIQEDELRFVELNFLQRMIRYLAGCIWYTDTIFRDKTDLEKVKGYVHTLKAELRDPMAMNLLPKAQTTTDFICLAYMLRSGCEQNGFSEDFLSEAQGLTRQEDKMNIAKALDPSLNKALFAMNLLSKAQSTTDFICLGYMLRNGCDQNGFSEEFLSEAIAVARQEDKINIAKTLDPSLDKALLQEILGIKAENPLPILQIEVPDEIKDAFDVMKKIGSPQALVDYLKALGTLEKINQELDSLPEILRPFLTQENGQKMVQDLSYWLIVKQVHPVIKKAYLEDEQQIVYRLCYHAGLVPTALRTQIQERVKEYRAAAMRELDAHYDVVNLGSQSDSFSACCNRYQKSTKSLSELTELSMSTGRPVVIVKLQHKMILGSHFEWIDGINLDFDQKPIILNVEKEIWSPVEEKVLGKT